MKYILRPAIGADYQYCYKLTKRNMFEFYIRHWGRWVPFAFRKRFKVETTTMVIRAGRRIGYYSLKVKGEGLYLDNIQLSPQVHGRGLGADLIEKIIVENKDKQLRLTTFSDNPAMRLYERLGFVITECDGYTIRMARSIKTTHHLS